MRKVSEIAGHRAGGLESPPLDRLDQEDLVAQRAQPGHILQDRPARSSLMGVAGNHAGDENLQALVGSVVCPSDRHGFICPVSERSFPSSQLSNLVYSRFRGAENT